MSAPRTLWAFGAWQVREDGVHGTYQGVHIPDSALTSWQGAAEVTGKLLSQFRVESLTHAEQSDMIDAIDRAAMWFQASPQVRRAWHPEFCTQPHRRRELAPGRDGRIRAAMAERFYILRRDGYRCQLCGRSATDGVTLEVDHKVARANGGADTVENKWTLCHECNRGKGAHDL